MSTRSYITMKTGDDTYRGVYCHYDGYLEYLDRVDQQLEEQSWDEYWPFSYGEADSSIETTVLSEYLGLDC